MNRFGHAADAEDDLLELKVGLALLVSALPFLWVAGSDERPARRCSR